MGHPRPLFRLFLVFFKQTIQRVQQINVKKCPSITQCWDSNSQPSNYESPPLTTRRGLPPSILLVTLLNDLCDGPAVLN